MAMQVEANNVILYWDVLWKFSQKISENFLDDQEANCIFSPLSAALSLSLVSNGAKGKTKENLTDLLIGKDGGISTDELLRWVMSIFKKIQVSDSNDLIILNSVLINKGLKLNPSFQKTLEELLQTSMESIDFEADMLDLHHLENIIDILNYLYDADRMEIKTFIRFEGFIWTDSLLGDTATVLSPFQISDGKTVIKSYIRTVAFYNYVELPALGAKAIEIPLKNDDVYTILIILPDERKPLLVVEKHLFKEKLHYILYNMNRSPIDFKVPMFSLESNVNYENALRRVERDASFSINADFSRITASNHMGMPKIVQNTIIEVKEEKKVIKKLKRFTGPENPKMFFANRPFLFYVLYRIKDSFPVILLNGRICNPQQPLTFL